MATNIIGEEFKNFLKKEGGKFEKESYNTNDFLISGMPRLSGKTSTVLRFLLSKRDLRILYVCRTIGKKSLQEGTAYATEKIIRELEKELKLQPRQILIKAGKEKVCPYVRNGKSSFNELFSDIEEDSIEEEDIITGLTIFGCERCSLREQPIPRELEEELSKIQTLEPAKCEELMRKYRVCPERIMEYFEQIATIHLISYSMLNYKEIKDGEYDAIIWDEARHLYHFNEYKKKLGSVNKEMDFPDAYVPLGEALNRNMALLPRWDVNSKISEKIIVLTPPNYLPDWWDNIHLYSKRFMEILARKLYGEVFLMHDLEKYIEEEKRYERNEQGEYTEEMLKRIVAEYNPRTDQQENLNVFIENLNKHQIRKLLNEFMGWYIERRNDKEMRKIRKYIVKAIIFLGMLYQIAGKRLEIEVEEEEENYNYYMVAYGRIGIPRAKYLNIYIDATPYPVNNEELLREWLDLDPEEINYVILPPQRDDKTEIVIAYEDATKTYNDIYARGDKSRPFKKQLEFVKGLKERFENNDIKVAIAARNKKAAQMLGSNGVRVDIVCRDVKSEGTTLENCDGIILEGTPRININALKSLRYDFGRILNMENPKKALDVMHQINTTQEMVQTAFRAIKKRRRNLIVLLGNKMDKEDRCWIELAKQYFPWLDDEMIKYIKINANEKIKNKVAQIAEVMNPDYDFSLTPLQNIIARKLKEIKEKGVTEALSVPEINEILREEEGIEKNKDFIREELNGIPDEIIEKIKIGNKTKYRYAM